MQERRGVGRASSDFPIWQSSLFIFLIIGIALKPVSAQTDDGQYRAFWIDTFNTALNSHADVIAVVKQARAINANAIFAQVRRRGDSWYLKSLEPSPDFAPIEKGFDPLHDLINEAHASGIEVHAFVIIGAIWNKSPSSPPSPTMGTPRSPSHVFNLHGGYDPATNRIVQGPNNWLTRTLLPDGANNISYQGHRIGSDFWIDPGHPDAAAYTTEVLLHLVHNYDIDGLHLDRIRYPEISIAGQTPSTGANIGYNETSVARFQRRHGIAAGSPPPAQNDPLWSQWRRNQVSNLVRRIYLNAIAAKPQLKVSAALIAYGGGPTTEAGWNMAAPYWRVFQDWRAWAEEGIIDITMPMNYKREHSASEALHYERWNEWAKNHQYNRATVIGNGIFLNTVEGSLRQTRRALALSTMGKYGIGVIFYSMATSNVASTTNPFSIPAGRSTPARSFAEFAAGLTSGKSVNSAIRYENPTSNPTAVFGLPARVPTLSWKVSPTLGHLMGFAKRADGVPLDTANVTIENIETRATRSAVTDGGGFYGAVDLIPGKYLTKAVTGEGVLYSCLVAVRAGSVTTADLGVESVATETVATINPVKPSGANGWYKSAMTLTLNASDNCSGVARTEFSTDGGAIWKPYSGRIPIDADGITIIHYRSVDNAGNVEAKRSLTVKLDQKPPTISLTAQPAIISPPNGQNIPISLSGVGADEISGLASVSYVVTDENGLSLSISPRLLHGASAEWVEQLAVEARRAGEDSEVRVYQVKANLKDMAGNTASATVTVRVPLDQK